MKGIRIENIIHSTTGASGEPDERARRYLLPRHILWKTEGKHAWVDNSEVLLAQRDGQVTLNPQNVYTLGNNGGNAGILLDFGIEIHGGIQVLICRCHENKRKARLHIRFGESAMEAMSELVGPENSTNDHAICDQEIEASILSMAELGSTGFRFVRIDLLEEDCRQQILRESILLLKLQETRRQ